MAAERTTSQVLIEPGTVEPREFEIPDVSGKEGLLSVEMTSICGTDIGMFQGDEIARKNCPVLMGHEVVGHVEELGEEAAEAHGIEVGDRVVIEPYIPCYECEYCQRGYYQLCDDLQCYGVHITSDRPPHLWGGYGEYMYIHPNAKVHKISEDVPPEAACLASVIGNGVRWTVTKGDLSPNDAVAIVGPGVQGLATTLMASLAGADPIVLMGLSSDDERLELGKRLGATHTVKLDEEDPEEAFREANDGELADKTFSTAPSPAAVEQAVDLVAPLGRAVIVGLTDEQASEIVMDDLIFKEADIVTGLGQSNNMGRAVDIVERHPDLVKQMITHTFPVSEAESALRQQVPDDEQYNPDLIHGALYPE